MAAEPVFSQGNGPGKLQGFGKQDKIPQPTKIF
jgi:hypothetical protein